MKMFIGTDHAGFELKEKINNWLKSEGYSFADVGAMTQDPADDYPDFIAPVAEGVKAGGIGILVCGSGIGMNIGANRYPWVRAVLCRTTEDALCARRHNHANVICLGAHITPEKDALTILHTFINEPFDKSERHTRRVKKLATKV